MLARTTDQSKGVRLCWDTSILDIRVAISGVAADKLSISFKDYSVTLCCFQRSKSSGQARLLNLLNGYQCSTFS